MPGINPTANSTNTTDVATFNSTPTNGFGTSSSPVINDTNRMIGSVVFDTANAAPFVIGAASGAPTLQLGNNLTTSVNASVVNPQTFNAPLTLHLPSSTNGAHTIQNNATSTAATLTLAGGLVNSLNSTRGIVWTLGGSNTGANIVSGLINISNNGNIASSITKAGAGTWILPNASVIPGGVTINGGILSAQNAGALGTSATANALAININAGTLDMTGGIALDNGLSLNLNNGGTIRSSGSNTTNGRINVAATGTVDANLTTVNAADVFTVGNEANDFTGGSATSVVHTAGPGTIVFGQPSNYVGAVSVDGGTTLIANANALGTAAASITFGAASTGKLQLNGNSVTVSGLSSNGTSNSGVIENGVAGTITLTVDGSSTGNFAGVIRDGAAGQITLVKAGTGTLSLAGTGNTYTGNTSVTGGFLLANNSSGSATGTGTTVTVSGTGRFGGSGGVASSVAVNGGGGIAPGTAGVNNGIGSVHVGALTLDAGSQLDYDLTSATVLDQTIVDTSGGLTINGGQLNISGAVTSFTTNGVYNLIGYSGGIGGAGVNALSVNAINKDTLNKSYVFGTSGGFVTLTVASVGSSANFYNRDANVNWSNPTNWTIGVPNSAGAFAAFGGGGATITAPRTVTVDGAFTVGTISFNNANFGYTLAPGAGGLLTLDNNASTSFISDSVGSHAIQVPLALTTNGVNVAVPVAGDTLAISGSVSGSGGVTKTGAGTLVMTGVSTYTGGTDLTAGTLQINSGSSLGDASGALTFSGGRLQLLADATTARTYQVNGVNDAVIDTNGSTLTQNGAIAPLNGGTGGVVKNGAGTLVLTGNNTYAGSTTVNAGVVSVGADTALGTAPAAAANNVIINNAGTLAANASFTLNANRGIALNSASSAIRVDGTNTLTYAGVIAGSGALNLTGTGTLALSAASTYTGNTVVNGATLGISPGGSVLGSITLTNGGTFSALSAATSVFPANNIFVPAGTTGTINSASGATGFGGLITSGDSTSVLNLTGAVSLSTGNVKQLTTGFTGTVRLLTGASLRFSATGNTGTGNGGDQTTFDLATGSSLFTRNNSNIALGALTGTGSVNQPNIAGNTVAYTIGAKGISTQFDGTINGLSSVIKVGAGTLTLTGANTYTGLTTVTGGTLAINGQFALGGAVYAGLTLNGGTLALTPGITGTNGTGDITADSTGAAKPVTLGTNGGTFNTNGNNVTFANALTGTGAFTKAGAGTLTLNAASTYTGATTIAGGRLQVTSNGSVGTLLTGPATAGVNLANGALVVDYSTDGNGSPAAAIRTLLAASFQDPATPGVMDTGTLRSSTATDKRGIGYRDNATLADGPSNTVTVQATLFGDADLDNGVSINDFNALAGNFGKPSGQVWAGGDFDYDGGVSINDFNLLAGNFGQTLAAAGEGPNPLALALWSFAVANHDEAGFIAATGVPEPTTLGLLAAGATLALRRRRAC